MVVLLLQLQSSLLGEPDLTITAEQLIAKGAVHQYRYLYHLRDTIEGYPGIWLVTVSRKPGSLGYMEWFHQSESPIAARAAYEDLAAKLELRLLQHNRPPTAKYSSSIWWNSQTDIGYSLQYADSSRVVISKLRPPKNGFRSSKPPRTK